MTQHFLFVRHGETVGNQERAACWLRFQMTHLGAFLGVPASGRKVSVQNAVFLEFRDGEPLRGRSLLDLAGLLVQVGGPAVPTSCPDCGG